MKIGGNRNVAKYLLVSFNLLVGLLLLWLNWNPNSLSPIASTIMSINILILLAILVLNVFNSRQRPLQFFYCIYIIFFYLFPGYLHLNTGQFPFFAAGYSDGQATTAAELILIFSLCVAVSYRFGALTGRPQGKTEIINLMPASITIIAVAIACGFAFGFENLLLNRGEQTDMIVLTSPIGLVSSAIARSGAFYGFMISVLAYLRFRTPARALMILVAFAIFVVIDYPLAIPRFLLGAYVIVFWISIAKFRTGAKLVFLIGFLITQTTLFSYISYLSRGEAGTEFKLAPIEYLLTSGDFDGFQSTINVVKLVEERGNSYGRNLASAILFFVPRDIWPSKSVGLGGEAASNAGYPFINTSSPLPAEFYVDFGLFGEVFLSFVFGLGMRIGDELYENLQAKGDQLGVLAVSSVAGFLFIILRGSLVGVLGPVSVSIIIVLLARFLTTKQLGEQINSKSIKVPRRLTKLRVRP